MTESPTVLYRSDESLRVASCEFFVFSLVGRSVLRSKPFCGGKYGAPVAPLMTLDIPSAAFISLATGESEEKTQCLCQTVNRHCS
eukprot:COSAG02_NODE_1004_length_15275_cov_11.955917_17_plen_85_part_00